MYRWNSMERGTKAHLVNKYGTTFCRIEQGDGNFLDIDSEILTFDRIVCRVCRDLKQRDVHQRLVFVGRMSSRYGPSPGRENYPEQYEPAGGYFTIEE